jgi:hypothetical protein
LGFWLYDLLNTGKDLLDTVYLITTCFAKFTARVLS